MDIERLPKIDLHCHLDGSLAVDMIRRHSNRRITEAMLCAPENCGSLTEYLEKFDLPLECLQTEDGLVDGARTFMREVAGENMKYVEMRFAPMLSAHEGLDCSRVIEAVRSGLEQGKREYGVRYGIIVCAMRNHTDEQNRKMLRKSREFLGEGVYALDLAGDESAYPNEGFRGLFAEAKQMGMPFVIHSGETGNVENVRSALEMGAARIGHGIAMAKDESLIADVAAAGVGVEMCPTSNFQTKAVRSWADYPLQKFLEAGVKVSIHTDNRTVSNTSMTQELTKIYEQYGRDEKLIYRLLENAAETAFDPEVREMYHERTI
jgi:adenosine deaminase